MILTRNQTTISFSLNEKMNHSFIVNHLKTYEKIAPKNEETIHKMKCPNAKEYNRSIDYIYVAVVLQIII